MKHTNTKLIRDINVLHEKTDGVLLSYLIGIRTEEQAERDLQKALSEFLKEIGLTVNVTS